MKETINGGVTITRPESHCYIFNPVIVEVAGIATGQKVRLTIGDITLYAAANNGKATFNIAEVLQSCFDTKSLSIVDVISTVSVSKTAKNITIALPAYNYSFTLLAVWGALQVDLGSVIAGDYNNDYNSDFLTGALAASFVNAVWHQGAPFTVSMPMLKGDHIAMAIDGAAPSEMYTATQAAIVNVSPAAILASRELTVQSHITFSLLQGSVLKKQYEIIANPHHCPKLHLRWIDKKGYYCHWAFDKGADSYANENYGAYINSFTRSIDYIDGFNGGDGRQQGKVAKRSLDIVAPLVTDAVWSYLLDITQSPIVDIYTDNDYLGSPRFLKVNVAPVKIARPNTELADFMATIELAQINNQRL